jgi:hypothetical protein
MTWSMLIRELDAWNRAGLAATFWWRDDDAVSDTKELDDLLNCAGGTPVALAVIPRLADATLSKKLSACPSVTVLQHGWEHVNRASGGPNSEYPPGRDAVELEYEFRLGRAKLLSDYPDRYIPVFAPPWHGFSESYIPFLIKAGIRALTRKGARPKTPVADLVVSNVHCVPIQWDSPPSFGEDDDYLVNIIEHLSGRRAGLYDPDEPTGILTHHLVQNARSYRFMERLGGIIADHPSSRWLGAREVFGI